MNAVMRGVLRCPDDCGNAEFGGVDCSEEEGWCGHGEEGEKTFANRMVFLQRARYGGFGLAGNSRAAGDRNDPVDTERGC